MQDRFWSQKVNVKVKVTRLDNVWVLVYAYTIMTAVFWHSLCRDHYAADEVPAYLLTYLLTKHRWAGVVSG